MPEFAAAWAVAGAVAAAGAASTAYQLVREHRDRRRYPPPGAMVDVDGRRVHLWRDDTADGPLCVVVAGLGTACLEWRPFQERMRGRARMWLYDRGGLGWSGAARGTVRPVEVLGDELVALLDAAGAVEPVVLIGHSMGGIIARDVAVRHPERVCGLLLVDSSHELMRERAGQVHWRREQWAIAARRRLTWYGLRRALDDLGWRHIDRSTAEQLFAPEWRDAGFALDVTLSQRRARIAECLGMLRGYGAAHARRRPLGDLPLTVLTAGPEGNTGRRRTWPTWLALQEDLAAQADDSVHTTVDDGEHHLHLHRPQAVEAALLDLLTRITTRTRT